MEEPRAGSPAPSMSSTGSYYSTVESQPIPVPPLSRIPEELVLRVLQCKSCCLLIKEVSQCSHFAAVLDFKDLIHLQAVSRKFMRICRDNEIWKQLCFEYSVAERRRRRLEIVEDPRFRELVRAADSISGNVFTTTVDNSTALNAEAHKQQQKQKKALLASWDPMYPGEKVDFYDEYIQRHARESISWFQTARYGHEDEGLHHAATGAGILFDDTGFAEKLIAPLEDGSVGVWDASASSDARGRIIAKSSIGLLADRGADYDLKTRLTDSRTIMTESGAIECVSIDSRLKKGFFAIQNMLNEVDLETLQVVARTPYPFAITALSEAHHPTPLTVGTNWSLHLHDVRRPPNLPSEARTELIGGPAAVSASSAGTSAFGSHVSLSQPGALSILHLPKSRGWDTCGDIWVGGRFTSFLHFDRRYFPRLRGTVHSGARISCLSALPYPFVPREAEGPYLRKAKDTPGYTLVSAGEYKGKGSLELYSLSSDQSRNTTSPERGRTDYNQLSYQNRQTASSSKLLSVAPHGVRLVFSDGDGNLKWVERDGHSIVRQFNINDHPATADSHCHPSDSASDIVQKILPTVSRSLTSWNSTELELGKNNLVIWTGDGHLGLAEFGGLGSFDGGAWEEEALEEESRALRDKEREYGAEMRRALEHQARELRWMRGYGL